MLGSDGDDDAIAEAARTPDEDWTRGLTTECDRSTPLEQFLVLPRLDCRGDGTKCGFPSEGASTSSLIAGAGEGWGIRQHLVPSPGSLGRRPVDQGRTPVD